MGEGVHPDIPQLSLGMGESKSQINLCFSWTVHMGLLVLELVLGVLVWDFNPFGLKHCEMKSLKKKI